MAIYEAPRVPSTGQKSGEAFGSGISNALGMLAQHKIGQIQQRQNWEQAQREMQYKQGLEQQQKQFLHGLQQQALSKKESAWEPIVGKGLAQIFASNPKAEAAYISQYGIPEQNQQSGLMQALQPHQQMPQALIQPQAQEPMTQQDALLQAIQGSLSSPEQAIQAPAAPLTQQSMQQKNVEMAAQEPWQILKTKPKGKLQTDLYKQAYAEQKEINKTVHPYVELIDKKGGTLAKASYPVIDRLSKLVDEGNLTKAKVYNQYKRWEEHAHKIGGGIGAGLGAVAGGIIGSLLPGVGTLGGAGAGAGAGAGIGAAAGTAFTPKFIGSPADQEFQKLTFNFMNGLKDIFGGRLNETEVRLFADSIPSLSQTKKGKRAILNNMRLSLDAWTHKKKIKDEIKKEYGGHYPANIEELVEERSAPFTDEIATKLVSGLPQ